VTADRPAVPQDAQGRELLRAALIASAVARHWADAAMEPANYMQMEWRVSAHPLGCVRAALAGETDPRQLGVSEGRDARLIRRIALRYGDAS